MSQTKAQLIQPVGVVTTKGVVVTGVVTATSFDGDVVGSATSIISGSNLNLGTVTAGAGFSAFSGDFTGTATGIQTGSAIKTGSFTATSFTGDFTGTATSMAQGTGFKAGTVTSTPADTTYTVTVSGGKFYLDSIQTPTPSFYPRATYTFDQSDSSNATHILRLATAADAAGSTEYTFQVTTNGTPGSSGAWTKIVVSPSAPDTLYYYCTAHSGMGGSINITNHLQGGLTGAVTGDVKGNVTGDLTGDVTGDVTGNVTGNVTGDASGYAGGLGVNYNGGWTGAGTSQITAGVVTATTFYGDGSNLSGVSGGPVSQQEVTINSATTNIDLSNGNIIYATQSADTTINFTNVTNGDVWFIRTKDNNDTARTITWPSYVHWDGGSAPTLISESIAGDAQVFLFVTRNEGTTWYAKEVVNYNLDVPFNWWRWGLSDNGNQAGLLGQNSNVIYSSPVQIPGSWTGVSGRLSVKQDGTLWALGQDGHGQAGNNTGDGSNDGKISSPAQIPGTTWGTSSAKIMGAPRLSLAIKKDGSLWSWGANDNGALGHNSQIRYSSPVQVGTDTDWDKINCNSAATFMNVSHGIKTDNTLWVWGTSYYGQLGLGPSPTSYSSPIQLPGTWSMTSLGTDTVGGIKTDGTLWIWGNGDFGKTAQNNTTTYSSPKQVGSGTDWAVFSASVYTCGAVKTNGTLWTWGQGASLGHNQSYPQSYSSPKQVGTDTTWASITIGNSVANALKTDGSLWVWGAGDKGAMGNNTETSYSSPIQVGTNTDWLNRMKKGLGNTGQSGFSQGGRSI